MSPTVNVRTNSLGVEDVANFGSYYYADFKQGHVHVPYYSTTMAMDVADWDAIQIDAQRLRILDASFTLKKITCSQQTVQSSAG